MSVARHRRREHKGSDAPIWPFRRHEKHTLHIIFCSLTVAGEPGDSTLNVSIEGRLLTSSMDWPSVGYYLKLF